MRTWATIASLSVVIAACGSSSRAQTLNNADASTADGALEAPGTKACLAAGGRCIPTDGTYCTAIGFQDCGPGARCCVAGANGLAVCPPDSGAEVVRASSYDQTCTVDTDCAAIYEGSTCNACNFSCPNAAINVSGSAQYIADHGNLLRSAERVCPINCIAPSGPCCRSGTCQLGYPMCPFPGQAMDASLDGGDASAE